MFKRNTIYTALFALLLFSAGCEKLIYDQHDDDGKGGGQPLVYLTVTHGGAAKLRSSNSQPDGPTINTDTDDYEDWVHDLALFVFDTTSGDLVTKYSDAGGANNQIRNSFVIELTPGQRDFYFVANMPAETLSGISNRSDMKLYLDSVRTLTPALYETADKELGFPMARVYTNQTVSEGGTVYQPAPFKPNGEDQVLLVRVVAKLEVEIDASEFDSVESITLKNAYRDYHLQHGSVVNSVVTTGFPLSTTPVTHYADITLSKNVAKKTFFAYMPEALMNDATWGATDHNKPINYFVIKTTSEKTFDIPIVTASQKYSFDDNYMDFATSPANPEKYNIFRNRRYHYQVKNLSDIEVAYKVNDWQYVPTSLYMGYGYNVEIDPDGNIKITNTIDDCMPHKVELVALNNAYFGTDTNNKNVTYGYTSKDDTGFTEEQMKTGYSEGFNLNNIPESGEYLEVWYNGVKVKTFSK